VKQTAERKKKKGEEQDVNETAMLQNKEKSGLR